MLKALTGKSAKELAYSPALGVWVAITLTAGDGVTKLILAFNHQDVALRPADWDEALLQVGWFALTALTVSSVQFASIGLLRTAERLWPSSDLEPMQIALEMLSKDVTTLLETTDGETGKGTKATRSESEAAAKQERIRPGSDPADPAVTMK